MLRHLLVAFLIISCLPGKTQCPQILNSFGNYTSNPQFINCNGSTYNLNFQSNSSFASYTINWGDGGPVTTGTSYTANTIITHSYAATTNTYAFSLTTGTCTVNGIVVQEQAAQAAIIPGSVGSTLCAPKTLTFTNGTTFTSATTSYTWSFGDLNNTSTVHTATNAGQSVQFTYPKGSVNCATQVTLSAQNYCNFTPSRATFGPLQVYDTDQASITADRQVKCWPDTAFTFTNSTVRNCLPQGNTTQRYERWNFGNYWGKGKDSVTAWSPWPPSASRTIAFPYVGVGSPYSVVLLDSNGCGVATYTISVNIVPPPVASVFGPTTSVCAGVPVTFTNATSGATQHRWNFGTGAGTVNLGSGNKTFTYSTPGTYTVSLIGFINGAGNSCIDTAKTVLSVAPLPAAAFSVNTTTGCNSFTTGITDLSSGAVAWNWNFGNGSTSTLQAPPPQSYTSTGTYTIALTVTNQSNCVHTSVSTVTVRPKPLPSFVQFAVCENAPVTFTNTSSVPGSQAISGYTWQFGNGAAASTATNPSTSFPAAGIFTVTLAAATPFCNDSVSLPVTVNMVPTASFAPSGTAGCTPFTVNFTNLSQNASTFSWQLDAAPSATAASTGAAFTYTNGSQSMTTHTVTLVALTTAGCSDSFTRTVSTLPRPVADFTLNTSTGCSPKITTFTNQSIGGSTYFWDFGNGSFSSLSNPAHTYSNGTLFTQTHTASLLVTNNVSCTDTAFSVITVYPEALTTFSAVPEQGCSPLVVNFPSVPGVATYSWSHGDGSPTYTTLTQHTWTFVNTGNVNKVFSVTLTAQTSNGCLGTGQSTVLVYNNPMASFTVNDSIGCSPVRVTFSNQSTGHTSSGWDFGNGTNAGIPNPVSEFTNSAGAGPLTYTVKLKVTSANGCRDSVSRNIFLLARPGAAFSPDTPACTPSLMKLRNKSSGAITSFWNFGDGNTSKADTATNLFVNNTPFPLTYPVKLVVTGQNGCLDSVTVPVTIHPKPSFYISASPDNGCSPLKVTFPGVNGVAQYFWTYDNDIHFGSAAGISNTFENKLTVTKTYTVRLVATDKFGCKDTASTLVKVFPQPDAKFSARPTTVFVPDQEVVFSNESSANASSFSWDFGDGAKSTTKSPVHVYTRPGSYRVTLIASTSNGCRDTFALPELINALEETFIQMPNAFTPNPAGSPGTIFDPNDTSNDIFHANVKGAERFTLSIYSRWGELLFETRDAREGWDGYYRGKLCTPDIYVWKLNVTFADGKVYRKTGDLLLLR